MPQARNRKVFVIQWMAVGALLLSLCSARLATLPPPSFRLGHLWRHRELWAVGCLFLAVLPQAVLLLCRSRRQEQWPALLPAAAFTFLAQGAALLWVCLLASGGRLAGYAVWPVLLELFLTCWGVTRFARLGAVSGWAAASALAALLPVLWFAARLW